MKSKPLAQLSKKYNISNSCLYQIWREQEFNKIQWNDVIVSPNTNIIDKQNEANFQNKYNSMITALENAMHDTKVYSSKSTDLASEGSVILGGKTKKTGGKKSKSVQISEPSSIQTQPIQASKKDINNVNLDVSYEKMVKKSTKII